MTSGFVREFFGSSSGKQPDFRENSRRTPEELASECRMNIESILKEFRSRMGKKYFTAETVRRKPNGWTWQKNEFSFLFLLFPEPERIANNIRTF
jgi:hypothetical protein